MSSFSRFQDINQKRGIANQKTNSSFIFKGYPSLDISNAEGSIVRASVVNQQEKDMAYVYTTLDYPLTIGSVWKAKGLSLLISEEIIIIKDVNWHKYIALLCNVEIDGVWGYFIGPEKKHIDVQLKKSFLLQSQQEPILVMPTGTLKIGEKIMIKQRGWLVQEEDAISTDGISYYSLTSATLSKQVIKGKEEENIFIEHCEKPSSEPTISENPSVVYVMPEEEVVVSTQLGFFQSDANINIISISANEVKFSLPFGVDSASIKVKQNSEEKEYVYKHLV